MREKMREEAAGCSGVMPQKPEGGRRSWDTWAQMPMRTENQNQETDPGAFKHQVHWSFKVQKTFLF